MVPRSGSAENNSEMPSPSLGATQVGSQHVSSEGPPDPLATSAQLEHTCADAYPTCDPQAIERLCQIWAEVGQAILARRKIAT